MTSKNNFNRVNLIDTTFVMSLFALIFSLTSLLFVIVKLGLSLGMEFVEKKEIREMKLTIERELKTEWEQKLNTFINAQSKKSPNVDKEITKKEIAELGDSTRHTQISSILLNVISKLSSNIIKYVIILMFVIIGLVFSIWLAVAFPDWFTFSFEVGQSNSNWWGIFLIILIILIADVVELRKNMKNYNSLRKQFYELSEDPSLLKAKRVFDLLRRKLLIYG